ncbi:MAG: hypothetical protein HRT57_04000 [Crocinitomicaceae bacterium]|nr:hypothetical protein [Crocinitomicaceae bacterium]
MSSLQKILYPLLGCFLLFTGSCGTQKIKWNTDDYKRKSAYTQKFVSGTEGGGTNEILTVNLEILNLEPKLMDSVEFRGSMHPLYDGVMGLAVNLAKGRPIDSGGDPTLTDLQAVIYYHKGEKAYKFLVDPVEVKETVYMP